MRTRFLSVVLAGLLIAGCGASVNPALVAKIDGMFKSAPGGSLAAAGAFTAPMPYTVGQWVMHGITADGQRSVIKTAIVGQAQGGWVIESYSLSPSSEAATQMCITGLEEAAKTQDLEKLDILWVRMRDENGKVQSVEGVPLSVTKGLYRKGLGSIVIKSSQLQPGGGDITVPAGTFAGCTKAKSEFTVLGSTYVSEGWYHPGIPINGVVKSVSDDKTTMELLAYGITGAQKSF
jgi:hypothetical protein